MKRAAVLAVLLAGCGGGGGTATPDAAVVTLTCDDPGLIDELRAAVVALPEAAFSDRAALLAAIEAAAAAIVAGPPRTAAAVVSAVLAHVEADVVNESDRVPLRALAQAAAATLAQPTLACPTRVTVACVPPGGKELDYGVGAADCVDPMPAVSCAPASGTKVTPGDSMGSCTATASDGAQTSCGFEIHAVPEGQPAITGCPASRTVACDGALTAVDLGAAMVEGCGEVPAVSDNAPAGGYPIGTTAVEVTATTASGSDTCHVDVTITDDVAPTITCPAPATVVRTAPAMLAAPPVVGLVADNCDDRGLYTVAPLELPRGVTTVTYGTTDQAGNVASCTTEVTVLDAFAPSGLRIATASLAGDGTTQVVLAWDRSFGADATGYRVERAPAADGPFAPLAMVSVSTQTLTDLLPPTGAYYRVVTLAGTFEGGGVGPVRAHAIAGAGYDLRDQTVPTVSFPTTLYGVVRHPVDLAAGPYPLVVLIHGNHGICRPSPTSDDNCATSNSGDCPFGGTTTPNAEGMLFQAETLAAHGYVAVTISANALNCRNDYILERSQLVVEHLRRWRTWSTAGGAPFGATFVGAVDTGRVGLVGHSRGGEAVAHVPDVLVATPVAGVAVGAVFSIAPTDYHDPTPRGVPYAVLLPACDGDVSNLDGMHIYDRALDQADAVERLQVLFTGANHNFFSTEWKFDDNGDGYICDTLDEVGGVAQRAMLAPTEAAWFDAMIPPPGTAGGLEPFLRAEGGTPLAFSALAGADLDLRWAYSAPARALVDDFSGANAPDVNLLGQPNTLTGFTSARSCSGNGCDGNFEHRRDALLLNWSAAGATAMVGLGSYDASGFAALSFRIVSRESALNDAFAPQDLVVRVVDGAGHAAEVLLSDVQRVPYLYPTNFPREILQTVRVPLADLVTMNPDLVLTDLAGLELEASAAGHATGAVIISDVEFAE